MKILFLSAASSIHTVRWVNALVSRNHIVYLAYLKNHKNSDDSIDNRVKKIELPVSGSRGYYLNAIYLRKIVKEIQPNVINAHYASGYGTLIRVARLKNTVLSVWGSDVYSFPYQNRIFFKIIKKNLLYADKIASTSNCMAEQVRKLLGKNVDITITPFGIDLSVFKRKYKEDDTKEVSIGCIKALEATYGIQYLVVAMRQLINYLSDDGNDALAQKIKCYIYGEGEERDYLEKLIEELHLQGIVKLMGWIPHEEVPNALARIDIFCATSVFESFGVSVIEAGAMEIPVVVSNAEGFCEVVENNVSGIIVEKESAEQVANALNKLVLNKELREEMGKAGRKRVEELYDWDKNVTLLENCYKEIASHKGRWKKNEIKEKV